ncbi:universal stress protein [Actinokineospora bangkokensis]|uniref:UspA domain-containing protein n=1 Tax=Actinokineospora bangkokensis TaxID=1193682 RepID=A0A1Q9LR03_9PSEU|nr:universal stress protein [Actinokineospora bangkokensis]OLR94450.1 hypothetical protein BJP25_11905 [Actinokineospora bangkokensis]
MPATPETVIAAVDGSPPSTRAVRWAAAEAARTGRALRLVSVHPWPVTAYPEGLVVAHQLRAGMRREARRALSAAAAVVAEDHPDLPVTTSVLEGEVVPRLRAAGQDAALVVLGTRGRGGLAGLVLGSVAVGLATHSTTPVVVVRGTRAEDPGVVAGLDGSGTDDPVLALAFAHAAATGGSVTATHAWGDFPPDGLHLDGAPTFEWAPLAEYARNLAERAVAPWRDKYPDTTVVVDPARGVPAEVLRDRSERAGLLVVGSHGRSRLAGLLLGSTTHAVLHHAACPVAVVPQARPNTGGTG